MSADKDLKIAQVIRKVFLLGFLVGKGQVEDDYAASGTPIGQTLTDIQQKLESLIPGSTMAADFNSVVGGLEKAENKYQSHISSQKRAVHEHQNSIIEQILQELKSESDKLKAESLAEVDRFQEK